MSIQGGVSPAYHDPDEDESAGVGEIIN